MRKKSLKIYSAFYIILNLIIYQVEYIKVYLESLFNNNKLLIYIKLPPSIKKREKIYIVNCLKTYMASSSQTAFETRI